MKKKLFAKIEIDTMRRKNEERMNTLFIILMVFFYAILSVQLLFNPQANYLRMTFTVPMCLMNVTFIINVLFHKKAYRWIKYLNVEVMLFTFIMISGLDVKTLFILFIFPTFFSVFYFDPRYTVVTAVSSEIALAVIVLNDVHLDRSSVFEHMSEEELSERFSEIFSFSDIGSKLTSSSQPTILILASIMIIIALYMSFASSRFYQKQVKLMNINTANRSELEMARELQLGTLSHDFPDNENYTIYANMTPADEVGGDFYDFFRVGDTQYAIVIGDVSGHGMSAAMYMMHSMTLIKVYARSGLSCDKVMERTNKFLESSNPQKLFITCWLGIIDLTTGKLSYTNAGHNYPVLLRKDKAPELLKSRTDFVLGRRRLAQYHEQFLTLSPGDKIVLYTDGITEARSPGDEFFGDDRLLETVKTSSDVSLKELTENIESAVIVFENGGKRYDDITVIAAQFRSPIKKPEYESKTFFLTIDSFDEVMDYISCKCIEYGCKEEIMYSIMTASSEILANIESYAYENGGDVEILTISRERRITIVFKDSGKPFDPTLRIRPDVSRPLSERQRGGLGIFIVKKLMDSVSYHYENDKNVLMIQKDF